MELGVEGVLSQVAVILLQVALRSGFSGICRFSFRFGETNREFPLKPWPVHSNCGEFFWIPLGGTFLAEGRNCFSIAVALALALHRATFSWQGMCPVLALRLLYSQRRQSLAGLPWNVAGSYGD